MQSACRDVVGPLCRMLARCDLVETLVIASVCRRSELRFG